MLLHPSDWSPRKPRYNKRQCNLGNLRSLKQTSTAKTSFSVGLWNCRSAVNKADFISGHANHLSLELLALTETWIKPEDSATPAALSINYTFSHTSRPSGRGGGTGLLISNKWKFNPLLPLNNFVSFEYHAVLVTAPVKAYVVVIYRPPGQLGDFLHELDTMLSSIPEHECPMLVLGDMNIHLDSASSVDFLSLVHSFDLRQVPTHKAGKELDLILARSCTMDNLRVTPFHLSDHIFIHFNVQLPEQPPTSPPMVSIDRNLCNLSPTHFYSVLLSSLSPHDTFSSLQVNDATDSLCSTLSSCLDSLCPLSTRPARLTQSHPWLSDTLRTTRTDLRAAERKWHKPKTTEDLASYQTLLSSFSSSISWDPSSLPYTPPRWARSSARMAARNLGVIINDQLTFSDHVSAVSRSCHFALFNIRKVRPYLTQYATQLLPLQMIQNGTVRLVFNQPKRAHVTQLLIELHWLPVAARIKFKSLMLAYRVIVGNAPTYLNALRDQDYAFNPVQDGCLQLPAHSLFSPAPYAVPEWHKSARDKGLKGMFSNLLFVKVEIKGDATE
ncbi:uncharacterized protein LOC133997409 [Scomber scombrus]|uniref:uncharacterized protein LOC133997409 n=1 Tax=Scomber scombrus TaxID=13677 RepID=UPI002DDA2602|nr:uncharacterized protein LOC133997409 [Scomber scombrus]